MTLCIRSFSRVCLNFSGNFSISTSSQNRQSSLKRLSPLNVFVIYSINFPFSPSSILLLNLFGLSLICCKINVGNHDYGLRGTIWVFLKIVSALLWMKNSLSRRNWTTNFCFTRCFNSLMQQSSFFAFSSSFKKRPRILRTLSRLYITIFTDCQMVYDQIFEAAETIIASPFRLHRLVDYLLLRIHTLSHIQYHECFDSMLQILLFLSNYLLYLHLIYPVFMLLPYSKMVFTFFLLPLPFPLFYFICQRGIDGCEGFWHNSFVRLDQRRLRIHLSFLHLKTSACLLNSIGQSQELLAQCQFLLEKGEFLNKFCSTCLLERSNFRRILVLIERIEFLRFSISVLSSWAFCSRSQRYTFFLCLLILADSQFFLIVFTFSTPGLLSPRRESYEPESSPLWSESDRFP